MPSRSSSWSLIVPLAACVALSACGAGEARRDDDPAPLPEPGEADAAPRAPLDARLDPRPVSSADAGRLTEDSSLRDALFELEVDAGSTPPPGADAGVKTDSSRTPAEAGTGSGKPLHVLLDSDTAAEVDDQHALAYLLFSADRWLIEGVSTNATTQDGTGGNVKPHTEEARRVVEVCASDKAVKVFEGASGRFDGMQGHLAEGDYDGKSAVDFIIAAAGHHSESDKLLVLAIGKLTNVALAVRKQPSITKAIRIVWLGSNYEPGKHDAADEYNEKNDYGAVNFLFDSDVELSVVLVRFGQDSGTFNVMVNDAELRAGYAKGSGPEVSPPVSRGGRTFKTWGDYSLFLWGNSGQRAIFDVVAVAIGKDPTWGTAEDVPAPTIVGSTWKARPDNKRKVRYYKNFRPHRDQILADYFGAVNHPRLQK